MSERGARLEAGGHAHRGDAVLGGLVGDRCLRDVTTRTRQPRSSAARNADSVSAVLPEYDEHTTSVRESQCSGRTGERFTSTGRPRRSRNTERTTSPDTAEPPIPQNVTDVTPSADGSCSTRRAESYAARQSFGIAQHGVQHPLRVRQAQGLRVVEVRHRLPPDFLLSGFSASSISITGMSSRTGYR